jgi:hypothetical protein
VPVFNPAPTVVLPALERNTGVLVILYVYPSGCVFQRDVQRGD